MGTRACSQEEPWAPFSVPQKTLLYFCWFLKYKTLPLPPSREIYNTPVFLDSKIWKDVCVWGAGVDDNLFYDYGTWFTNAKMKTAQSKHDLPVWDPPL